MGGGELAACAVDVGAAGFAEGDGDVGALEASDELGFDVGADTTAVSVDLSFGLFGVPT
jgi:hypothetical protein